MAPKVEADAAASKAERKDQERTAPRSFFGSLRGRKPPASTSSAASSSASSSQDKPKAESSQSRVVKTGQARRPPSLLSVAPSTRTITGLSTLSPAAANGSNVSVHDDERDRETSAVASGSNYSTLSVRTSETDGGALNRLKKMASNASLASTIRGGSTASARQDAPAPTRPTAPSTAPLQATDEAITKGQGDDAGKGPSDRTDDTGMAEVVDSDAQPEATKPLLTKRPSDGLGLPDEAKQARRRTWFGFQATPKPAVAKENTESENTGTGETSKTPTENQAKGGSQDVTMNSAEEASGPSDPDAAAVSSGNGSAQPVASSWLPWRGPSAQSEMQTSTAANPSYTDTVWRYVSWNSTTGNDSQQQAPSKKGASQPAARGWLSWGSPQEASGTTSAATDDGEDTPMPQADGDCDNRVAAEPSLKASRDLESGLAGASENISKAQPSLAARWIPYWGAEPPPTSMPSAPKPTEDSAASEEPQDKAKAADTTEMTPAEQYKAESLARLGAKDAVINPVTRSAWINYFGNRRTAAPPARMQDSIDEPEVMRLNLNEGDSSADAKLSKGALARPTVSGVNSSQSSTTDMKLPTKKQAIPSNLAGDKAKVATLRLEPNAAHADPAPPTSRPMTPLTSDRKVAKNATSGEKSTDSALSSKPGKALKSPLAPRANLLLPTFDDVFSREPRNLRPQQGVIEKTLSYLFSDSKRAADARSKAREDVKLEEAQFRLPRHHDVLGHRDLAASRGCKPIRKVTIIGVHGWFSTGPLRNIFGEPTGTSVKFSTMMRNEVRRHFEEAGHALSEDAITSIALEADGKVSDRVDKSFSRLISNQTWVNDIFTSDAIFIAAHSQGSVVATHLLARLIEQRHIDAQRSRVALLCMCGIHNGPFHHLRSSMTSYYMSAFETPAAKELFDFQDRKSPVSQLYAASLRIIVAAGVKLVYVASLDDQVVPLYSALHTSASHPSILRAIFCDGAAFPRVDFLTNLLSFCLNVRNAGLHDHHLVTLLSSSVAGSLYGGVGHSLVYEEPQVYALAVRYLLEVSSPAQYPTTRASSNVSNTAEISATAVPGMPPLILDAAEGAGDVQETAKRNNNPYTLPWSLRGLLEDDKVRHFFADDIRKLVRDYEAWAPTTKTLKDVQFRLEPLRMVSSTSLTRAKSPAANTSNKTNSKL